MQASDATLANDPALNAMKGVADYMMGRYADARIALSSPRFDNDPHAALWRGLTEAKLERWSEARRDLAAAESCCAAIRTSGACARAWRAPRRASPGRHRHRRRRDG